MEDLDELIYSLLLQSGMGVYLNLTYEGILELPQATAYHFSKKIAAMQKKLGKK